ncbi:MAG: hypothetical protein ACPG7F_02055 [Aggregatilineales bacterium]
MTFSIDIAPRRFLWLAGGITLLVLCQSFITEAILEYFVDGGTDTVPGLLLDLFSVNLEESIPTWYSTLLLFVAAVVLAVIAWLRMLEKAPFRWHWTGLALIFLYLSMDEGAAIHEIATDPLQAIFDTSGYLSFAWLLLAVPLVLLFGLIYLRFWWQLPAQTRTRFLIAALLYVGGAVVIEAISANQWGQSGVTLPYLAIATLEEGCEMFGVVVFIYALLDELRMRDDSVAVKFVREDAPIQQTSVYRNAAIGICMVLIAVNALLTVWLVTVDAPVVDVDEIADYSQIVASMQAAGVSIHYLPGDVFLQNPIAQQIARDLLKIFDEMMILTLPHADLTIIFAANRLPYDTDTLTMLLNNAGERGFIVFDTVAIRALVGQDS